MKPLDGYRVLDLTGNISGPFATMILADLGAEVIKIERVDAGDDARHMSPFFADWSAYFAGINRNKKSVAVNLKDSAGIGLVLDLAGTCDVVVQNFRGSKAEAMGLGYEAFRQAREDIVYCSISAYGETGPQREDAGYDALVQAQAGLLSINGANSRELARVGVSLLDMGSGMWAALGVLAALLQRKQTGRGQEVGTSLYESGIMWGLYHLLYCQALGRNPEPQGTRHTAFAPYGAYGTADGQVFVGISNDRLFGKFAQALDRAAWSADSRFARNADRLINRDELEQKIVEAMRGQPSHVWMKKFATAGVPAANVKSFSEVLEDPQLEALGLLESTELAGFGRVRMPKLPLRMAQADFAGLRPPPLLGQHTEEVLAELQYGPERVRELLASKAAAGRESDEGSPGR